MQSSRGIFYALALGALVALPVLPAAAAGAAHPASTTAWGVKLAEAHMRVDTALKAAAKAIDDKKQAIKIAKSNPSTAAKIRFFAKGSPEQLALDDLTTSLEQQKSMLADAAVAVAVSKPSSPDLANEIAAESKANGEALADDKRLDDEVVGDGSQTDLDKMLTALDDLEGVRKKMAAETAPILTGWDRVKNIEAGTGAP